MAANVTAKAKRAPFDARKLLVLKVGAIGFEPTTSRSRTVHRSGAPLRLLDSRILTGSLNYADQWNRWVAMKIIKDDVWRNPIRIPLKILGTNLGQKLSQ